MAQVVVAKLRFRLWRNESPNRRFGPFFRSLAKPVLSKAEGLGMTRTPMGTFFNSHTGHDSAALRHAKHQLFFLDTACRTVGLALGLTGLTILVALVFFFGRCLPFALGVDTRVALLAGVGACRLVDAA